MNIKWGNNKSLVLTQILLLLFALALLAADLTGPVLVRLYLASRGMSSRAAFLRVLIPLYACSPCAWLFLGKLWQLLTHIRRQEIFTERNVRILRFLSWDCFAVALLLLAAACFYLPFVFVMAAAGFTGLIIRIVKNVFQQALAMKDELDLTI